MRVVTRPFHSIARTVLRNVVVAAAAFALVIGAAHSWYTYQKEQERVEALTSTFALGHVPLLMVGIWDLEAKALQRQVNLIAAYPEIAEARVQAATGMAFSAGLEIANRRPDVRLPIPHPTAPGDTLGELQVWYDNDYIGREIVSAIVPGFIEFALFALVVSLITYRIIFARLNKPLRAIADYSRQLTPGRRNPPLELERKQRHWEDEIDLMVDGFNTLRDGIARFSEERDQAINTLSRERDLLDERVRERTQEMRQINDVLESLSRLSVSLIDVPDESQQTAMVDALARCGELIEASAVGIAVCHEEGEWAWRYRWSVSMDGRAFPDSRVLHNLSWAQGWYVGDTPWSPHGLVCTRVVENERYLLTFHEPKARTYTPLEERLVRMAAEVLFKVIERWENQHELESSRRELYRLSRTDPLTGLANRRYFNEVRDNEGRRVQRTGDPLSVLMIDVDFFKAYNDQYGHSKGDRCLVRLAEVFRQQCARAGELSARLGGEEFAILLPGHDEAGTLEVAERVRAAVYDLAVPHEHSPMGWVTVSIGCATWFGDRGVESLDNVFDQLMRSADRCLYKAKALGRNRVEGQASLTTANE